LERPLVARLVLMFGAIVFFFGVWENVLRWRGFEYAVTPVHLVIEGHGGKLRSVGVEPDPDLIYRQIPGTMMRGRMINSLGYRSREVDAAKAAGVRRVICMGDSVTAQGRPDYAEYLHRALTHQPPGGGRWEAFNAAVYGYSALQGLKQYPREIAPLRPDYVTVFFGWNDHWLTDVPDRLWMEQARPTLGRRIAAKLCRKRFYQWMLSKSHQTHGWMAKAKGTDPLAGRELRVPPEDYRATLTQLVEVIRASGATPILLTAPGRPQTDYIVHKAYAHTKEEAWTLHGQYNEITREVARATGADMLDLAAIMADTSCDALFAADGIHFDRFDTEGYVTQDPPAQPGLQRVADEIYKKIAELAARSPS
jgi:lysophospholipase L1-like esterase